MNQPAAVPPQPSRPPTPQLYGKPPTDPKASEAGRLLCAGSYLDRRFRDQVIDHLYIHEERFAAPSYGIDAARVLAHALRARRIEVGWSIGVLAAWLLAGLLSGGVIVLRLLLPCLLLSIASGLSRARKTGPALPRPVILVIRIYAWTLMTLTLLDLLIVAFVQGHPERADNAFFQLVWSIGGLIDIQQALLTGDWLWRIYGDTEGAFRSPYATIGFLGLLGLLAGLQRGQFARTMSGELSREKYHELAQDPAETFNSPRFLLAQDRIRTEQSSPVVLYATTRPFLGAGAAFRPWHLAVELQPRDDIGTRKPDPVDNAEILRRVVPLVEALRVPSPRRDPQAAAAVLDRLRELVVDECVFLPAAGLRDRDDAPHTPEDFARHRAEAIEEGGEKRRHFLRIRVGGWDEDVVVTVFVRVHTQGGVLMLEVAPHVLLPVRELFQEADDMAQRHLRNSTVGKVAWAIAHGPRSLGFALLAFARSWTILWQELTAGNKGARPTGPEAAVRELGSEGDSSLFQTMDIDRYLKTIQDRVASGVRLSLYEAGWQTAEFERKTVNLAEGAVYIHSVTDSAFGVGDGNNINPPHKKPSKEKEAKRGRS
ncbi:hypothetical protein [Streptomyces sp. NPDC006879]|uniref:hypothetical protein n=1 Tax=Streptomyces sp. NPDC006879 TaxID=3364767 RepID=UPI0036C69040